MSSVQTLHIHDGDNGIRSSRATKLIIAFLGIGVLLTIAILALCITTLIKVNSGFSERQNDVNTPTISSTTASLYPTSTTRIPSANATLVSSIHIEEMMSHLSELQRIANTSNGNRAINTIGFNRTLDYITNYLTTNTSFNITKTFFPVRDFALASDPILVSNINGVIKNHTYSTNLALAEFLYVKYSTSVSFSQRFELTIIPNGGCTEGDWQSANRPAAGRIALVKRGGSCAFADRAAQAPKFNVSGVLFYNDGILPDRFSPIEVSLGQDNALPALFLSYNVGQALADAAQNTSLNVTVQLGVDIQNLPDFPVGNICADTPTGDVTQTIVVGGHSDSVPAGPGINDNGK
jgi:hypothetical protein